MEIKRSEVLKTVMSVCLAATCVTTLACSSGYYTAKENGETKVYRVDTQGTKTLVYETDRNGQTTIHDADDPMAKQHVAAQATMEPFNEKSVEQSELQGRVSKRQPNDPIYVSLAPPMLDEKMQQAEKSKGVVAERIRNEFVADPVIKLIEPDLSRSGLLKPHQTESADVEVSSKVSLKEAYGIDQKTGKPSKVLAVVFEATITSHVPPATYNVSELGYAVRNQEVSKRFANHVKQVIVEKIGPAIPAR